jgi:hypothetical protein
VKDKDIVVDDVHLTPYRLNLSKLGFKLYEDVYLCDTNTSGSNHHVEWLRPVETAFMAILRMWWVAKRCL